MTAQDQSLQDSQIHDSQVQLAQAGQNAVSFQDSRDNHVTINNALLQFGRSHAPTIDWDWAKRLLQEKQLPTIRKRLTDTLGRDRALMAVSLAEDMSLVGRSPLEATRVLQVEGQANTTLDPRQLLITTFGRDDIGGKLLILGTPGAGKTTALLSLAEQLVCGALAQPQTVIPVLFELSTWRKDNQSIRDWLIEQLYDQHGGDRQAKRYEQWLDQQVLLPLMDGLDELGFERQQKCTQKLKEFAQQYPHSVVCCRTKEFTQAGIKLNTLNGAMRLEPLSDEQIQAFLTQQKSPLWSVIQQRPELQNLLEPTPEGDPGLLRVPLFVTLAARTYDPQHPFQNKADLLNQYVDRQLSRDVRESDRRNDLEKRDWAYDTLAQEGDRRRTQQTLSWLARELQRTNTVEFLIERIQPRWLETTQARRRYRLNVMLSGGLSILLSGGLGGGLNIWLIVALAFGVIFGLLSGLICRLNGGLIFGLIAALTFGLTFELIYDLNSGLIFGLIVVLIFGLIIKLISGLDNIQPIEDFGFFLSREALHKILSRLKDGLIFGLIFGLCGLSSGLIFGLSDRLILDLFFTPIVLSIVLSAGLSVGLMIKLKQDLKLRSRPNQGIWNSFQSLLWVTVFSYPFGIIFASITELQAIVTNGITEGESIEAILSLLGQTLLKYWASGIFAAFLFGFSTSGGQACVQHVCLRWVLWQSGVAPWNLARFLNYCVERRLLQRVGGTYRFVHRELLDHFAERVG